MTLDVKWKKRLIQSVWGAERFHTVTDCSVSKNDYPLLGLYNYQDGPLAVAGEGEEKTVSRRSTVRSIFPEKVGIVFKEEMVPQSLFLPSFSSSTTHIVVPSMDTWRECWVDLRVDLAHPDSRMLDLTMCWKKCLTTLPSQMAGGWNLTKLRKAANWAICVILFYW